MTIASNSLTEIEHVELRHCPKKADAVMNAASTDITPHSTSEVMRALVEINTIQARNKPIYEAFEKADEQIRPLLKQLEIRKERLRLVTIICGEESAATRGAREDHLSAERAYSEAVRRLDYDALAKASDDGGDDEYDAVQRLTGAVPSSVDDLLLKLEFLAVEKRDFEVEFIDVFDLVLEDAWSLGSRHVPGDESAQLHRAWRRRESDPDFDEDRSNAHWRVVNGRPVVVLGQEAATKAVS